MRSFDAADPSTSADIFSEYDEPPLIRPQHSESATERPACIDGAGPDDDEPPLRLVVL